MLYNFILHNLKIFELESISMKYIILIKYYLILLS